MSAPLSNNTTAQVSGSRPALEHWLALLVRYWAYNMSLIHARGGTWPGFGYSDEEKATLQSIAGKVPGVEYYVWLALVVVIRLECQSLIADR